MRYQFHVSAPERMGVAGGKARERHAVLAADARIERVNLTREAVRRQPLDHRVGVEKGTIHALGRCTQHAMKLNRMGSHRSPLLVAVFSAASVLLSSRR